MHTLWLCQAGALTTTKEDGARWCVRADLPMQCNAMQEDGNRQLPRWKCNLNFQSKETAGDRCHLLSLGDRESSSHLVHAHGGGDGGVHHLVL